MWRKANKERINLFRFQGRTPHAAATGWIVSLPGVEPWWRSKMPYLRFEVEDELEDAPERFFEAMPDEHLFTALYADSVSRAERVSETSWAVFGTAPPPSSDFSLPSGMTVKEKVSAQQIAVDIWTHLIENYLA
jgi:hypothetical protein